MNCEHGSRRLHCPPELESGWRQTVAIFTLRFFTYTLRTRPRLIRDAPNTNEAYEIDMAELEPSLLHRFHDSSDPYDGCSVHIDPEIRRRFLPEIDPAELAFAQSPPSRPSVLSGPRASKPSKHPQRLSGFLPPIRVPNHSASSVLSGVYEVEPLSASVVQFFCLLIPYQRNQRLS